MRQELEGKLKTSLMVALKNVPNERFETVTKWMLAQAMKEIE